ncbi:hypothetical protein [uncultured Salegentibacter sp.]|uniref:hypothetical protein n=1 Tax=uncultured Salegentibacter sp. TaxID=259320 RepID=UPI00259689A3|nr:hypothetical protein [uncultured Salegentibacter sp.]
MNKLLLLLLAVFFTASSYSQKMYIWCPEEMEPVEQTSRLNGTKVYLNIEDVRLLSKMRKEKCSSEELVESLEQLIAISYPNAEYTQSKENSEITIQIQITAYYSEFHTAAWKGKTEMNVEFMDNRNGENIYTQFEISKSKANANFGGMKTAKNNLIKSYNKAVIELLANLNRLAN